MAQILVGGGGGGGGVPRHRARHVADHPSQPSRAAGRRRALSLVAYPQFLELRLPAVVELLRSLRSACQIATLPDANILERAELRPLVSVDR